MAAAGYKEWPWALGHARCARTHASRCGSGERNLAWLGVGGCRGLGPTACLPASVSVSGRAWPPSLSQSVSRGPPGLIPRDAPCWGGSEQHHQRDPAESESPPGPKSNEEQRSRQTRQREPRRENVLVCRLKQVAQNCSDRQFCIVSDNIGISALPVNPIDEELREARPRRSIHSPLITSRATFFHKHRLVTPFVFF